MFVTVSHFKSVLIFAGKAKAYLSGALVGLIANGKLLTLPSKFS
jgi:hypothetical protein